MIVTMFLRPLVPVLLVLATGCAAVDKLRAPTLLGTPADSALVVVKVEASMHGMLGVTSSQGVNGGVLLRTDGSRRIDGRAVSGLIIFSNVPPGEYNLAGVETQWQAGTYTYWHKYAVPPESVRDFVFSVNIGEPRFVGPVAVQEFRQSDNRGVRFSLKASKEAERDAWAKVIELYPSSAWTGPVQRKQAEP